MMRRVRLFSLAASLVVASLAVRDARADAGDDATRAPIVATRRQGFAIGGTLALRLGEGSGTPTAYARRSAEYEVKRAVAAPGGSLFVGDALSDHLVLGPVVELGGATRDDVRIATTGFGLRIDAYPFASFGGRLRDLGVGLDVGTGTARFSRVSTGEALAESGAYSMIGAHAFFEELRLGGLHLGPALGVDWRTSATFDWLVGWLGVRGGFYAGP